MTDRLRAGTAWQWKAAVQVAVVDPRTVVVTHEQQCDVLTGRHVALLAPYLAHPHTLEELFDSFKKEMSPPEITYTLDYLIDKRLLVPATSTAPEVAAFWQQYGLAPEVAEQALAASSVRVCGPDHGAADGVRDALSVLQTSPSTKVDFRVIAVRAYTDESLRQVNSQAIAAHMPWMLVKLCGTELLIGPVFRPLRTGCWECLAQRLESNRQIDRFLQNAAITPTQAPVDPRHPALLRLGSAMAAHEIIKAVIVGPPHDLSGEILAIDSRTMITSKHILIRRPQCSVCGTGSIPPRTKESYKVALGYSEHNYGTGTRTLAPELTYQRLKKHVSHLTGVVRHIEPIGEGTKNGLTHSYASGHNFALMQNDLRFALLNLRGRSGGKGTRDIDARVGAICEAIERYSGVYRGDETVIRSNFRDLPGRGLRPNDLMLFSAQQFSNRENWNKEHRAGFHRVPEEFTDSDVIGWTPAYSLTRNSFAYVPSAFCYFGHPDLQTKFFCSCDSNGNAAGNTLQEAILQGLLELIERDAVAIWWYNCIRRAHVDLSSFRDPYVDRLRDHYAELRREIWLLDITSDFGVPVFAAISRATQRKTEDIILGFGAHLDAKVAAYRALAELNQFLPAVAGTGNDGSTSYWFPEEEAIRWWKTATVDKQSYLKPLEGCSAVDIASVLPPQSAPDQRHLLELLDIIHKHALEVLVLEQSQPDVELSVVKVMVPGLRHFWKRFAPGRLYDVPVKLGWRERPQQEHALNPRGIFF